jgi:inhibitor of KinA
MPKVLPLGDSAAYVEFSETLDLAVNAAAQTLAEGLRAQALPWCVDIVPTLGGVALHFDLDHAQLPAAPLPAIEKLVEHLILAGAATDLPPGRLLDIPVCYAPEYGLDLLEVAERVGMLPAEVVRRHTAAEHRVLMMGFVPGCPYMGGLDPALNLPRRLSPRTRVPQGSVAIANLQVVLYPFATPGGWHILGRTPRRLFVPERDPACLFAPRDRVRFVSIDAKEFEHLAAQEASV